MNKYVRGPRPRRARAIRLLVYAHHSPIICFLGNVTRWFELVQRHHPPPTVMKTMFRKMPGGGGKPFPVQVPLKLKFISQVGLISQLVAAVV